MPSDGCAHERVGALDEPEQPPLERDEDRVFAGSGCGACSMSGSAGTPALETGIAGDAVSATGSGAVARSVTMAGSASPSDASRLPANAPRTDRPALAPASARPAEPELLIGGLEEVC